MLPSLKTLWSRPQITYMMECHNGLSAQIAQKVGFEALWGSGLSMSASRGVRDANELSWTQVVDACEDMAQSSTVPLLVDGDTT